MPASKGEALNRVGECLYRNHNGMYYALVKVSGKQIKRSLKTSDLALAKRRLAEFREKAERLTGHETSIAFDGLSLRWLALIKPQLKASSYARRVSCLNCLTPYFKGLIVLNICNQDIEKWRIARTGHQSENYIRSDLAPALATPRMVKRAATRRTERLS